MKLTIDNRKIETKAGLSILDIAEGNDIYIPNLCSHPELAPYGACRLCIVEVEGMRGLPTACTTQAVDGMVIRTNTKSLQDKRKGILQLLLSEHPSACLICEEEKSCADFMDTIRKVGTTTGCRWCPKNEDCELQKIVRSLNITTLTFSPSYHNLPLEKFDPFFDRDYNLCIYCARCVRICQEHRKSFVLALNQRGKSTVVGPAFHLSHIEADCEFCGACISVCPTGAISEKTRKWEGVPEEYTPSACPLCGHTCDIQILKKDNKIVGTLPSGDPHESGGELCVKGRFCLTELVNHPDRILEPQYRFPEGPGIISWDEAIQIAGDKLKGVKQNRVGLYLSPHLTNEEIVAANQFCQKIINTTHITSSVLNNNLIQFFFIVEKSVPLKKLEQSDCIISLFLNGNYNYAPLTLAIKRAAEKNTPYLQIGWITDTTSRFADHFITPSEDKLNTFLKKIIQAIEKGTGGSKEIKELVQTIKNSKAPTIILGPGIMDLTEETDILKSIEKIKKLIRANIYIPNPYGNLQGLLSLSSNKPNEEINQLINKGKIDMLYLIGDSPFKERPNVNFIIHQSSFPPSEGLSADLILPTPVWGEISGSSVNINGNKKKFKGAQKPPFSLHTNQEIFTRIAKVMGKKDVKFSNKEISKHIPKTIGISRPIVKQKLVKKENVSSTDRSFPFLLIQEKNPHIYQNVSLINIIAGMKELLPEDTIFIHPEDASRLGFCCNESVIVKSRNNSRKYPIILRKNITKGMVFLIPSSQQFEFGPNPCPVKLRRSHV